MDYLTSVSLNFFSFKMGLFLTTYPTSLEIFLKDFVTMLVHLKNSKIQYKGKLSVAT